MKKLIFLGGSTNRHFDGNWRDFFIHSSKIHNKFNFFNPVVKVWNDAARRNEEWHREHADILLFNINGNNAFSIAEVVDCSNKRPESTILLADIAEIRRNRSIREKSILAIAEIVQKNGAFVFFNKEDTLVHFEVRE